MSRYWYLSDTFLSLRSSERGLKYVTCGVNADLITSLRSSERGLKLLMAMVKLLGRSVRRSVD